MSNKKETKMPIILQAEFTAVLWLLHTPNGNSVPRRWIRWWQKSERVITSAHFDVNEHYRIQDIPRERIP